MQKGDNLSDTQQGHVDESDSGEEVIADNVDVQLAEHDAIQQELRVMRSKLDMLQQSNVELRFQKGVLTQRIQEHLNEFTVELAVLQKKRRSEAEQFERDTKEWKEEMDNNVKALQDKLKTVISKATEKIQSQQAKIDELQMQQAVDEVQATLTAGLEQSERRQKRLSRQSDEHERLCTNLAARLNEGPKEPTK